MADDGGLPSVTTRCRQGDIYKARTAASGNTLHYHIILRCFDDGTVAYVYTTSQVDKVEAYCRRIERIKFPSTPPSTMVIFDPSDAPCFSKQCAVNCTNVHMESWSTFIASTLPVPVAVLQRTAKLADIIQGILQSPVVETRMQSRFLE